MTSRNATVAGWALAAVGLCGVPLWAQTQVTAPVQDKVNAYQYEGPWGCAGCKALPVHGGAAAAPQPIPAGPEPKLTEAEKQLVLNTQPVRPGRNDEPGLPQPLPGDAGHAQARAPQTRQMSAAQRQRYMRLRETEPNNLPYDLLLVNGHVIDPKNHVDRVTDVAIKNGLIAAVGDNLRSKDAAKTIDLKGYYVVPGLIDIHTHNYATTGQPNAWAGDLSVRADAYALRTGTTTVGDAGCSGWRNFEDFKEHVIDRQTTRILAFLNIVGAGMRGGRFEDNLADMQAVPTAWMAKRYPQTVIGIKSAHFTGPEWWPYEQAEEAGKLAHIPVMIDYGAHRPERPTHVLLEKVLRKGDIYTHVYSGLRGEQDPKTLGPQEGLVIGRKRGIYFDAGTGGGSFRFRVAVPLLQDGFYPDSLSTDHHADSMNSSTKDILNVMSKFMAMGQTLQEVVAETTWHPAVEIQHRDLGNFSVGSVGDVAVLSERHGTFGFLDMDNTKLMGNTRLICQLTIKGGQVVYDLNGLSMDLWNQTTASSNPMLARHWTIYRPIPPLPSQLLPKDRLPSATKE